jgi:hypothetical protein
MKMRPAFLVLLTLALVCAGCSEDDEGPIAPGGAADVPASDLPFPDTPDQVLANFMTIYETMDFAEYEISLDPAFACHLQPETMEEFPALGPTLEGDEEIRLHSRMFSGEDLTDASGAPLPAIQQFSFGKLRKLIDWGESLDTDPIPNTLSALYAVEIIVDRGQSHAALKVDGQIRFYVKPAEGRVDGESRTYYRLVGQLDWTQTHKASEIVAWGSLKSLYY